MFVTCCFEIYRAKDQEPRKVCPLLDRLRIQTIGLVLLDLQRKRTFFQTRSRDTESVSYAECSGLPSELSFEYLALKTGNKMFLIFYTSTYYLKLRGK